MKRLIRLSVLLSCVTGGLSAAAAAPDMRIVRGAATPWQAAPDSLPKGAQFALLSGNPDKPGPFAFRLKVPAGYVVMPHTHPAAENLTVVSGRIYHGMGRTLRRDAGVALAQGDFVYLPAAMPHSVWTTEEPAIIQVNGTGPFTIRYIRPQDDPRTSRRP